MVSATRPGHSLPELIVAVTFLGTSLGVVGVTAAAAAGRTRSAIVKQEAVRQAGSALDSLLSAPVVHDGERRLPGMAVRWRALGPNSSPRVEVTAVGASGRELVRLEAGWFPREEVLPWPDAPPP